MQGRICVVTGASAGIGQATAMGFAQRGATVALVCRNRDRAEATRAAIRAKTGNEAIDIFLADLASREEIRRLARELIARYPRLHVLVNNAGVFNWNRETTVDGIETVFAVNHLAYFLLTHLLLQHLKSSAPARIINVASDAHRWGSLNLTDLQHERGYRPLLVYGRSKLCNILFTRELARRLQGTGVTVNCVHPGGVATGLGLNNGWMATVISTMLKPFIFTPEQGADTVLYLATSAEVENVSGKYFIKRRERQPSAAAVDDETARQLWRISAGLTALTS